MSNETSNTKRIMTRREMEGTADRPPDGMNESAYLLRFINQTLAQTELDGISLLDARAVGARSGSVPSKYSLNLASSHPISTLASTLPNFLTTLPSNSVILSMINKRVDSSIFELPSISGLESCLPQRIRSHLFLPFFSLYQPVFFLIGICRSVSMSDKTTQVARSLGGALLASLIQSRQMEVDTGQKAFLASLSHELRTPLHNTLAGLDLAHQRIEDGENESAKEMLGCARASGEALSNILNDLLDFATGLSQNNIKSVKLEAITRNIATACLAEYPNEDRASKVTLHCERRVVKLDETKFNQILAKGFTNSLKFCSSGNIVISVTCCDGLCLLRIKDTGIGFDEIELPRLLEPFQKHSDDSPGLGLGLYFTRRLTEQAGGTFILYSKLGEGSTFEVVMPVVAGKPEGDILEVLREPVGNPSGPRADRCHHVTMSHSDSDLLRVLIVDDNHICLNLLYTALRRGPTPIILKQAVDGLTAVEVFEDFHPDLVITDVSMPKMDGLEAAQKMRTISDSKGWSRCKIYTLTGLGKLDSDSTIPGTTDAASLDGWLVKGLDKIQVIHRIIAEMRVRSSGVEIEARI